MNGRQVGSYRITEKLGEGGMGAVYEAVHLHLDRRAVVKVLKPELSENAELIRRFFNEAKAASSLDHPGIVSVFDFGFDDDGRGFIIMEHLKGETLSEVIQRGCYLDLDRALRIVRLTASALKTAHEQHIVHRDLKPDNLFIVEDPDFGERVKVLDFGIARICESDDGLTKTGAIMGTPAYMSPEQCAGESGTDPRADVYSLGCVFFEMLTCRPVFEKLGVVPMITAHLTERPHPPSYWNPSIPGELDNLILAMLAKEREDRPADMSVVVERLDHVLLAVQEFVAPPDSQRGRVASPRSLEKTVRHSTDSADSSASRRKPMLLFGSLVVAVGAAVLVVSAQMSSLDFSTADQPVLHSKPVVGECASITECREACEATPTNTDACSQWEERALDTCDSGLRNGSAGVSPASVALVCDELEAAYKRGALGRRPSDASLSLRKRRCELGAKVGCETERKEVCESEDCESQETIRARQMPQPATGVAQDPDQSTHSNPMGTARSDRSKSSPRNTTESEIGPKPPDAGSNYFDHWLKKPVKVDGGEREKLRTLPEVPTDSDPS